MKWQQTSNPNQRRHQVDTNGQRFSPLHLLRTTPAGGKAPKLTLQLARGHGRSCAMTPAQLDEVWAMLDREHLASIASRGPEPIFATISGAHLYGFASPRSWWLENAPAPNRWR